VRGYGISIENKTENGSSLSIQKINKPIGKNGGKIANGTDMNVA